jgi:hypothetical protein
MSFSNLKRNRGQIEKLVTAAEAVSTAGGQKSYNDDRMWKPTQDKMGNGYAVIRFLPAAENQELPWVRYWDHGFKGPTGKWYIERSLTSVGKPDPVGELNSKLWNSGYEEDKKTAQVQKRRLHYVSNILVLSDPANPENEGKVFMYQYGKKIFDKLMDMMQPQFQDEKPVNPFDFWEGANFKIKIRKVEGWTNYDKSEFDSSSELFDGDDTKLEGVYNSLHDLGEFTKEENYKSYEELQMKLNSVLGTNTAMTGAAMVAMSDEISSSPMRERKVEFDDVPDFPTSVETVSSDDEDTMSYFARLANGD